MEGSIHRQVSAHSPKGKKGKKGVGIVQGKKGEKSGRKKASFDVLSPPGGGERKRGGKRIPSPSLPTFIPKEKREKEKTCEGSKRRGETAKLLANRYTSRFFPFWKRNRSGREKKERGKSATSLLAIH